MALQRSSPEVSSPAQRDATRLAAPTWKQRLARPATALALVLLVALALRTYRLGSPRGSLIFDELYYVNAARTILGTPESSSAPYAFRPLGRDPNLEHPPLGKLFIAGSMAVLGDNAIGWRLPSIIAGMASIVLLYGLVRAAGGDDWLAVLAAAIFSLDNLVLVHSRIATLDIFVVAFLLLAAWLYLDGLPLAAGIASACAALVKLNAIYGLLALVLFELARLAVDNWRSGARRSGGLRQIGLLLAGFLPAWIAGLWLLDLLAGSYRTPWEHLAFMARYGVTFSEGTVTYRSYPWQWLANEVQLPYLRLTAPIEMDGRVLGSRVTVFFRGAMNPLVIGAAPLAISFAVWRSWRHRDRISLWAATWVAATYLSYLPFALLSQRIMFLYYMLPVLPAIAVAIAQLLRQSGLPRAVTWGYLAAVAVALAAYFPYREIV
jgi:predicted membrane-bound dolichyl-phosphate-mannose-protein mannosyltransferase